MRDTEQPVETTSPSPRLVTKFGGKLSGLIAGDKDQVCVFFIHTMYVLSVWCVHSMLSPPRGDAPYQSF